MRKYFLYAAIAISYLSIFASFYIELSYKNVLSENSFEKKALKLTKTTQTTIENSFANDVKISLNKIENLKSDIQSLSTNLPKVIEKTDTIDSITLLNNENNVIFSSGNIHSSILSHNPCDNHLFSINNKYFICVPLKDKSQKVLLSVSPDKLKNLINQSYKQLGKNKIPISILYFNNKLLYLNFALKDFHQNKKLIQTKILTLLEQKKDFDLTINGKKIFIGKITFNNSYLKNFYLFLGIPPYGFPFTNPQLLSLIFVMLICFYGFFLGVKWVRNLYPKEEEVSEDISSLNKNSTKQVKKEYRELRSIIKEIKDQENSYQESKDEISEEFSDEDMHVLDHHTNDNNITSIDYNTELPESIDTIPYHEPLDNKLASSKTPGENLVSSLQEVEQWRDIIDIFPELGFSFFCQIQDNDTVLVEGITKNHKEFYYTVDMKNFHFPTFIKENRSFYVYKEAGKTTLIKKFLEDSFINPSLIEGSLVIPTSNNGFLIHLFYNQVDHYMFSDVYRTTSNWLRLKNLTMLPM